MQSAALSMHMAVARRSEHRVSRLRFAFFCLGHHRQASLRGFVAPRLRAILRYFFVEVVFRISSHESEKVLFQYAFNQIVQPRFEPQNSVGCASDSGQGGAVVSVQQCRLARDLLDSLEDLVYTRHAVGC